ncbi:MAG: alkaline phosphatase PhoX [Gammaproteobacteria bacterium]
MRSRIDRRGFLAGSVSVAAVLAAAVARSGSASPRASARVAGPYGPLAPVADLETGLPLILLPRGFQYRSYAWSGDTMPNGQPVPDAHDGMGVIHAARRGRETEVTLVRNHERSFASPILAPARYDTAVPQGQPLAPGGGTTTLRFRGRRWLTVAPSLGGTIFNCAGGVTPWGTWLSCEETVVDLTGIGGRHHGYVFEVRRDARATTGRPIVDMGRMLHEAVAIDPATRIAFLTEDNPRRSCFYRFLPKDRSGKPGSYEAGGRLQAAKVAGVDRADLTTPAVGDRYPLEWIEIENPDSRPGSAPEGLPDTPNQTSGPFLEAWAKGAARLSRGEGICFHAGRFYLVDTAAGISAAGLRGAGDGAVWEYDPRDESLEAIFVATTQDVADNIDNITVRGPGGIWLCEDGNPVTDEYGPGTRLLGLTAGGDSFAFAKNNVNLDLARIRGAGKRILPGDYRGEEWAGICFDPAGEVMFVNIQRPGITFAIWGPFGAGS